MVWLELLPELSLEAMKCIHLLFSKRLIPFSCRDVYSIIVDTIVRIMQVGLLLPPPQTLTLNLASVTTTYIKSFNLILYQLVINYLAVVLANPQCNLLAFFSSLWEFHGSFTQSEVHADPGGAAPVPPAAADLERSPRHPPRHRLESFWNSTFSPENSQEAGLGALLEFLLHVLLPCYRHPIHLACDATSPFSAEADDLPSEPLDGESVDSVTGDFAEIPFCFVPLHTEADLVTHHALLVLAKLWEFRPVREAARAAVLQLCMKTLEEATCAVASGEAATRRVEDGCVVARVLASLSFEEENLEVLVMLSRVIQ